MAARNRTWTPEVVRQKIRTSMLINRVQDHALGKNEMTPTQMQAATLLLRKTLPDLMAVAHSGAVELTKPEDLTDQALAHIASPSSHRVIEAPRGEEEPDSVH